MAWELDGRRGTMMVGGEQRDGFALMRNPEPRLLAVHAVPLGPFDPTASKPPAAEQFVIDEEAFRPAPDATK
jgi:hypothetical protein